MVLQQPYYSVSLRVIIAIIKVMECSSEVICVSDPQKLALTLPTSGGHSVGIVCSRTQATELVSSVEYFERGL
jgi:hypothetical protein